MAYVRGFPDRDGDSIPDIPEKYRASLNRNVKLASWNPYQLLKGGTRVTWITFGAAVVLLAGCALLVRLLVVKVYK
jgi:hypothetical protein